MHLHKLQLGRIQSILGFVGLTLKSQKGKKKESPGIVGRHFKHSQHVFGINSTHWGWGGVFFHEG